MSQVYMDIEETIFNTIIFALNKNLTLTTLSCNINDNISDDKLKVLLNALKTRIPLTDEEKAQLARLNQRY
jgi:hypothetical protein